MRRALCASVAAVALALAGCGGSDGDGGGDKAATASPADAAQKFMDCFKKPGYQAVEPKPGEESLFAAQVKQKGYESAAVNVTKPNAIAANAYVVFFEDEATANKAKELVVTNEGDPAPLERGQALAGYLDNDSKTQLEPAISACL